MFPHLLVGNANEMQMTLFISFDLTLHLVLKNDYGLQHGRLRWLSRGRAIDPTLLGAVFLAHFLYHVGHDIFPTGHPLFPVLEGIVQVLVRGDTKDAAVFELAGEWNNVKV